MKTKIKFMLVALMATVIFSSCERVAPNYAGVLMENYGKKGKNDFKIDRYDHEIISNNRLFASQYATSGHYG